METDETVEEAHRAIQASITNWGHLLIATGGALKPPKCFGSLISFDWKDGKWSYASNHLKGEFGMTVPLPNGTHAPITHHPVDHAEKTLGAMTAPDGNCKASITMMQSKGQDWVDDIRRGHLNRGMVWFSMKVQFWPRVGFSICNSMATFAELAECLQSQYYKILPLGGVVRTAPRTQRVKNDRLWILRPRPPASRGGGTDWNVKQALDALWMQVCSGADDEDITRTFETGSWHGISSFATQLCKVFCLCHTLLAEDAVGKAVDVWVQGGNE